MFTFLLSNINLCPMTFVLKDKLVPDTLPGLRNVGQRHLPVRLVVEVQRPGLVHLLQLLPVPEVQGQVRGDDGLADDLQHLLVLAGAQGGEDVVPFQLRGHKHTPPVTRTLSARANPPPREGKSASGRHLAHQ